MSNLGEELKEKEAGFDDASTAAPTPMERSTANSIHSSKDSLEKEEHAPSEEVGTPLEPVESSMYPNRVSSNEYQPYCATQLVVMIVF
jgi:hypothetical protein